MSERSEQVNTHIFNTHICIENQPNFRTHP